MLTWEGPDDGGVLRAYDDHALYVIAPEDSGGFRVGYFPSPGPVCTAEKGTFYFLVDSEPPDRLA